MQLYVILGNSEVVSGQFGYASLKKDSVIGPIWDVSIHSKSVLVYTLILILFLSSLINNYLTLL